MVDYKKLPRSVRKHIRKEKARIRREISDKEEQIKQINELYKFFEKNYEKTKKT